MFWRLIGRALTRRRGGRALIAVVAGLGATVASAMLSVVFDVSDRVAAELTSYGANIVVQPRGAAALAGLYGLDGDLRAGSLREDEVANIKTIFWAFNITAFAPFLDVPAVVSGTDEPVTLTGTWFSHPLDLASGEHTVAGVIGLRAWWEIEGGWIADQDTTLALADAGLAARAGWELGDSVTVTGPAGAATVRIAGLVTSGGDFAGLLVPLAVAQDLAGRPGEVDRVEVAALTTPDNDLARRAARDPSSLTISEWETWYCTAYASAIAYQIEEVMTGATAKPVRQITEAQGNVLTKTQALMLLVTALALAAAALAIANLITAAVLERSAEIGLLKALGATDGAVVRLVVTELGLAGLAGGAAGWALGLGAAQVLGWTVFGTWITPRPVVAVLTGLGTVAVMGLGSLPAIRLLLRLRPAGILHGR